MASSEPFTFVTTGTEPAKEPSTLFDAFSDLTSAHVPDLDIQLLAHLRRQFPDQIITSVPTANVDLLAFASAGHATATLDIDHDSIVRWRGYIPPPTTKRNDGTKGTVAEAVFFARYHYQWAREHFILYFVTLGLFSLQYVVSTPGDNETPLVGHSAAADALIFTVGEWQVPRGEGIYVYDGYWYLDQELYEDVKKTTWDKVILDPQKKKDLTEVTTKFFDSKDVYDRFRVPFRRGVIFHGPVGNGKTMSIKALMHTLLSERDTPIPCLYVKSARETFNIGAVFAQARALSPCMLVLEDIETIVNDFTRSYFLNELDGLAANDGILIVATTNFLDRLDPGLAKRPSRFDRKYLFPLPSEAERTQYAELWYRKLEGEEDVQFPKRLCRSIASITEDFSFAYLNEAFVSTLLELARDASDEEHSSLPLDASTSESLPVDQHTMEDGEHDAKLKFWTVMKRQVALLREDMDSDASSTSSRWQKLPPPPWPMHAPPPPPLPAGVSIVSPLSPPSVRIRDGNGSEREHKTESLAECRKRWVAAGGGGGGASSGISGGTRGLIGLMGESVDVFEGKRGMTSR